MAKTIKRTDLAEAVHRLVGLSRLESDELVIQMLGEISECVARGEDVLISSFGSFVVRSKSERVGRNPKIGIEAPITPRRVMVFKPSNVLKGRVNSKTFPARNSERDGGVR